MKVYGRMTVFPIMPSRINRLYELAYNLWWSWHPEARALYSTLDLDLWEQVAHNPVRFLSEVQPQRLEEAANDVGYLHSYDSVLNDFDSYMHPHAHETWFSRTYPELSNRIIAYFSAEFGLHEWPGHPFRRPLQRGQRSRSSLRRSRISVSPGLFPPTHYS